MNPRAKSWKAARESPLFRAVNINSTQSYAPSYTTNYAEAQSADSKAKTKVSVKADLGQSDKLQIQIVRTPSENNLGANLNAKA